MITTTRNDHKSHIAAFPIPPHHPLWQPLSPILLSDIIPFCQHRYVHDLIEEKSHSGRRKWSDCAFSQTLTPFRWSLIPELPTAEDTPTTPLPTPSPL